MSDAGNEWWSPSSTWRLLQCPASATPASAPAMAFQAQSLNAGTLAHKALHFWISNGGWLSPDPATTMQEAFERAVLQIPTGVATVPNALVTQARLRVRANELAGILRSAGATVESEVLLRDHENRLFGYLDILSLGAGGLVVDLKTSQVASASTSARVRHQMEFYAQLYFANFHHLPARIVVFDLRRGPKEVGISERGRQSFLIKLQHALERVGGGATPSREVCQHCLRRLECEPYWSEIRHWDSPDSVEGTVQAIERSAVGSLGIQINGKWLTGFPEGALPNGFAVGSQIRAVSVRHIDTQRGSVWMATPATRLRVLGPTAPPPE